MKIDFSEVLNGLDGSPLKTPDQLNRIGNVVKEGKPQTLGMICVDALVAIDRGVNLDGKTSFERYQLAAKINGQGETTLEATEIVMLEERIGKVFGPAVVGPAYKLLKGGK